MLRAKYNCFLRAAATPAACATIYFLFLIWREAINITFIAVCGCVAHSNKKRIISMARELCYGHKGCKFESCIRFLYKTHIILLLRATQHAAVASSRTQQ
jgi:hypothetical protein